MRTIRRLYFYLVSAISFELVIWGMITLGRTIVDNLPGGGTRNLLASGLSLVLVGVPIFLIHWRVVQRDAERDVEERSNRIRALYLYGIRIGILIPVVQNILAVISRLFMHLFGLNPALALVGSGQTLADNLIAIVINLIAWAYIERILQSDWNANLPGNALREVRRLYRYAWVLYGLGLAVVGVDLIFRFIFYLAQIGNNTILLANGLSLTMVGTPLWVYTWLAVQNSLSQAGEQPSMLRLTVLYLLALSAAIASLAAAGVLLAAIFRIILGYHQSFAGFLDEHNAALALIIPVTVLWGYYGDQLKKDIFSQPEPLRRAGLQRLYAYVLALIGNAATFYGLWRLLSTLVDIAFHHTGLGDVVQSDLASALAALATGLPVWLATWPNLQAAALQSNDAGDHARRSIIRKSYLYFVLFITIVGVMSSAGALLYLVFNNLLGNPSQNFWLHFTQRLQLLILVSIWLVYHLTILRKDGQHAQQALGDRHAAFPALIIQTGQATFAQDVVQSLRRIAPRLPVVVHALDSGPPNEALFSAKVVILPSELAVHPSEALRLWLDDFTGKRILVPMPSQEWLWLDAMARSYRDLVQDTAQAVRSMAEDQPVHPPTPTNAWMVAGYVLGALFGLQLLTLLMIIGISLIKR
ncbi:MAG TPA: DUF5671 domain-containing protein [Anaerolineaceae bacterium]|nr:DUF5671 domain-containing protein [Anaerolineaceae bacterium]